MIFLEWFIDAFSLFGGFLAFLLVIPEIFTSNKTKFQVLFAIALTLTGTLQFLNTMALQGILADSQIYLRICLPILFSTSPLIYLAILAMIEEEFRFNLGHAVYFLPVILFSWIAFLFPLDRSLFPWDVEFRFQSSIAFLIFFVLHLSSLYAIFFGILIFRILSSIREFKLKLLIGICFFDFFSFALLGLTSLWAGPVFLKLSCVVITLALCMIYYSRKHYSDLEETIHVELVKAKYSRTRLRGLEIDSILSDLERMMKFEKIYQNEDVSLGYVAERLSLTTHQLSELINQRLNKSFFAWLNQYRIEEAKQLLIQTDKTVLEIAMEVGFNNRSSFNEAFLKFTETTPIDYKRSFKEGVYKVLQKKM
ncbi:helix-turn-helix domain-containing protein [Leptospira sp. WS92.C1]